ncbi:MAG: hypothetical protein U5K79_07045 [Cyclobacteriaceae bacterium]|nr:hypothetical protein [Cyclobacteriaceae bacterium]
MKVLELFLIAVFFTFGQCVFSFASFAQDSKVLDNEEIIQHGSVMLKRTHHDYY